MQIKHTFNVLTGWFIDGTLEPVRKDVVLGVSEGLITSVRNRNDEEIRGLPLVDLSQCTLLPGLIDSHVHLSISGTNDPDVRRHQLDAPFEDMKGVITRHLLGHLSHGVAAVRDGGDHRGHSLRYRRECLAREEIPVQVLSGGPAWHAPGRYGRPVGRPLPAGHTLARSIREGRGDRDFVKIVNSGMNSLSLFGKETPPQFSLEALRGAVRAGKELGLKTMVHANGREAVKMAIQAGCHSVEHGFFMGRDNLKRMADLGITWVPTVFTMAAYVGILAPGAPEKAVAEKNLEHQIDQIRIAREYGVPVATGTDAGSPGVHHGRALREEIRLLMAAEFSPERAIQCATLRGAELLGLDHEMGRLSPGMAATFVAVRGGPEDLPDSLASPERLFLKGREWRIRP
jgi:imidazolonepropionase-like amidohydrolase